ncbi:putative Checkpoint serine/threonine-protein kinase bub1 [Glarea lozoyensis 74030]|uniref:Putative Checkpoint serine/threonine-protein kinase bub1 n=1 Tax=Glarea lozoyensis (strain ATCC 74030 / MF5533) TaxID=1104152 RepID=H0EFD3_GLAL7|nr:putative Checkpoint serine/threonine-protein kinase bub1 [Glarea lozoyensis 74030]
MKIKEVNETQINEDDEEHDDTRASKSTAAEDTFDAIEVELPRRRDEEELVTPISPDAPSNGRMMFVPIPPEDYEPAMRPYRDPSQVCQNRLPFMTPIAEKTESSLGLPTARGQKDYFNSKTPSKGNARERVIELGSSPFREIINEARPVERIAQPQLVKQTKPQKVAQVVAKVPFAKEMANKGPIIKDAQCNPVDDYTRALILEQLQPPLSTYEGFFEHKNEDGSRSTEIKKFAKAMAKITKNASDKTTTNLSMPPTLRFPGTSREYIVKRELGAGAFAPVYLLENVAANDEDENSVAVMGKGAFSATQRKDLEALKMEDPPSAWEFYIMRQAKRRLGVSRAAESIINVYEMHLYKDECYLIEEFREQGTLLDAINLARTDSTATGPGVMDELMVMFFTVELFRTMESLHSKSLLHGDLKADNCLVRLDALSDSEVWTPQFRRDGTGGWNKKGIALIDFGRGIDMKAFRPDVQFIADWKTGPQDCAEMRELRPWTWQIDYHGLAGIIHSMLFGKYIDTVADKGAGLGAQGAKTWRIRESLKRYWQTEIWSQVFALLLNPAAHLEGEEGTKMPVLKGMRAVREVMEEYLEANSEKGGGLQAGIRKLEGALARRR